VAAVVVSRRPASFDTAGVLAALKERIANYKVPKRVFVVEDLPRNAMGKVHKNVLRDATRAPSRRPAGRRRAEGRAGEGARAGGQAAGCRGTAM